MLTFRAPLVIALVASGSGCALVTSFDGFGGGAPADGGRADGQGGGPRDAQSEGASGDDAGNSGGFCQTHAPQAIFCADFDEGSPTTAWLHGTQITGAGLVSDNNQASITTSTSVSPPGSLAAVPGGPYMFSDVELDLMYMLALQIHVELDVSPGNTEAMPIVEIDFCNASCGNTPPYDFEILLNQNGNACIGEHGNGCTPALSQPGALAVNQWAHVTMDADMLNDTVTLSIDGIPPIHGALSPSGTLPSQNTIFAVGLPSRTTGAVHVDNVLFDVR